jgi:hypothetical protein
LAVGGVRCHRCGHTSSPQAIGSSAYSDVQISDVQISDVQIPSLEHLMLEIDQRYILDCEMSQNFAPIGGATVWSQFLTGVNYMVFALVFGHG